MPVVDNPYAAGLVMSFETAGGRAVDLRTDAHGRVTAVSNVEGCAKMIAGPVSMEACDVLARHAIVGNPEVLTRKAIESLAIGYLTLAAYVNEVNRD